MQSRGQQEEEGEQRLTIVIQIALVARAIMMPTGSIVPLRVSPTLGACQPEISDLDKLFVT